CLEVSNRYHKQVMIDLLNTSDEQKRQLQKYNDVIFCEHVSKDQQEELSSQNQATKQSDFSGFQVAVAGGIKLDSIKDLIGSLNPAVVIIGSAITKADNPSAAAQQFKQVILHTEGSTTC
ncbi:MAG: orotidine 5'-phosphate decarboxylase / HUMPS family protein, partial [Bacillus sp. (in: firmicutes)]